MLDPYVNKPHEAGQVLRWLMTHQYVDIHGHKPFYERFNDWCASPYFIFDFMRDSSDTSGFVTIRSMYELSSGIASAAGGTAKAGVWPGGQAPLLFCVSY